MQAAVFHLHGGALRGASISAASRRTRIRRGCALRCTPGIFAGVARRMFNVFEEALPRSGAEIGSIRGALLDGGALGAVMTGTGSAVFGVFDDRAAAAAAYERLSQSYRECFLVRAADALTL